MISNPARFFTNGTDAPCFTYEGGSTLFHWSPHDSGLSDTMESNVIFFADNVEHARDVLRRLLEFWIKCNKQYAESNELYPHTSETKTLTRYLESIEMMKIVEAPTNQFYVVGWAYNDTLNV